MAPPQHADVQHPFSRAGSDARTPELGVSSQAPLEARGELIYFSLLTRERAGDGKFGAGGFSRPRRDQPRGWGYV